MIGEGASYNRLRAGRLRLTAQVLTEFQHQIQREPTHPEAGGVLLGRWIQGCSDVVVDAVTTPLPGDQRGPCHFHRAREAHQRAVDRYWREQQQRATYLGEWHTHPQDRPVPSRVDFAGWTDRLRDDVPGDALFFVIVGRVEMVVYEGQKTPTTRIGALSTVVVAC